jgi:hypothetical protein
MLYWTLLYAKTPEPEMLGLRAAKALSPAFFTVGVKTLSLFR